MGDAANDRRFMAAAIRLSRWNTGNTATNPSVGCLVVKDGVIVGRGVTAPGGRPHAETQALAEAGEAARGATVYVTLEPCSHHGKTPPCADALIAAGVARVVVAVTDPDARVSGRGVAMLREAGIAVETGMLEADSRAALAGYLTRQTKKRPYVTLKLAVSADRMIGRSGAGQVAITGPVSRAQVHALRAETDAILIGIGTALADDPDLTCRLPGLESRSPVRIVLDPRLSLPVTAKLATTARDVPVIVVASEAVSPLQADSEGIATAASGETASSFAEGPSSVDAGGQTGSSHPDTPDGGCLSPDPADFDRRRAALEAQGVEVLYCSPYHPQNLLPALATRGISSLLVEGGAKTARLFLESGLIDRILAFHGPGEIGAGGIESPIRASDMPSGFRHIRSTVYGLDRCDEYERES